MANQVEYYTAWYDTVISSGLSGDLIWCVDSVVVYDTQC